MSKPLFKQIVSIHSVPFSILLLVSLFSWAMLFTHSIGWMPWQIALVILIAWFPLFLAKTTSIYRRYHWLALFFVLAVVQSVHFIEHIAQMIQIHFLGFQGMEAHGIFGMLDLEVVHFTFDGALVPICTIALLFLFRKNPWLWVLLVIVTWHGIEHFYIMSVFLRTGIQGTPGLLSHGGAIAGGLPLIRPDLHFLYNLVEESLIVVGYIYQIKQTDSVSERNRVPREVQLATGQ